MAYSEHKIDSKLIHSPVPEVCGDPNDRDPGNGVYNGEKSPYQKRSGSSTALPEKTLDEAGDFGKQGSVGE